MKNIIKYTFISMILIFVSCDQDELVSLSNPNRITSGSFWQSETDAYAGVTAIYQSLITDGVYMRKYMWTMDGRSDDCFNVTPITYIMSQMTSYTRSSSEEELYGPWECHYSGIWRANQALDNIDPIVDMDEGLKKQLKGEAHGLRGLYYFNLANLFGAGNIVIYKHQPESVDDYYVPQAEADTTWTLIYDDFTYAMENCLTQDDLRDNGELGRFTQGAAAAFLAKAYLMNGRYEDALPILEDLVNGEYGTYDLVENYADNFTETNENNIESIFEIQYDMSVGSVQGWGISPAADWQKQDGYGKGLAPKPVGWGDICPTPWIWNQYHAEAAADGGVDARVEASFIFPHYLDGTTDFIEDKTDFDPDYTIFGNAQDDATMGFAKFNWSIAGDDLGLTPEYKVSIRKCMVEDATLMNDWKSGINRRIIRYADILLLYAECINEVRNAGGSESANIATIIKPIRDRANLPDRSAEFGAYSQAEMREQLIHERTLELSFESWRYLDLLRWGWFEDPAKLDELKSHDPEFERYIEGREYMAVPTEEIGRNPEIKQNPAWN